MIDGESPSATPVKPGVSWGMVLGALIFLVYAYINDINKILHHRFDYLLMTIVLICVLFISLLQDYKMQSNYKKTYIKYVSGPTNGK